MCRKGIYFDNVVSPFIALRIHRKNTLEEMIKTFVYTYTKNHRIEHMLEERCFECSYPCALIV